ncbi:uncharacterized protein LOC129765436 [Toxorhynchites rutilus septentrionalis]|uniref:uncharacterized protein LOC129765436 n=1 Tax=Toxorhynchites rutilus septentrionalis TaxID=329112 RepID=UPI002479DEEB|nr:uncharacterized protein LOC129765436 [Toxorhynchites rutilus septentrionalis]
MINFVRERNMAKDWHHRENRLSRQRPPPRLMASANSHRRGSNVIVSSRHQSRFHAILYVFASLMTITTQGAEFMTAGIAGGGPPSYINTPLENQNSSSTTTVLGSVRDHSMQHLVNDSNTNQRESENAKQGFGITWNAMKYVNKGDQGKKRYEKKPPAKGAIVDMADWKCPNISQNSNLECGCDLPHTLRCRGDLHGLELIAEGLRASRYSVSLLDCTLKNVTVISDANIFENVSLQGLVISSGEIKRVHRLAFGGMKTSLQALGLPNNALASVPMQSLASLPALDRLDLSNNRIKAIQNTDFFSLTKLSYLELSENQISLITTKSLLPLRNLIHLKLNGNRLGESPESLLALEACLNLRELDLRSNTIRGPLRNTTLPVIKSLEILNLDKNSITSIQNGAIEGFSYLQMLSLRYNQIDVLQDHAFSGLASLQVLDLGHNGIVAISGSSLKHLPRLIVLDLTHNFLRALTADIVSPLPSLKELRLDGNDISIIAQNALYNALQLHSLSLENNPLACDCSMKPFAEWLATSQIAAQDVLGAVCATPPHLEGAALLQIAAETMSCNGNGKDKSDKSVFKTIEVILKLKNNMSYVKDIGTEVQLKGINFTDESDVFLYWGMQTDDYSCRFVYTFHDDDPENILYNSEVSCKLTPETANATDYIFITKLVGAYDLQSELSYKFCLIMKEDISKDEYLGACKTEILPAPYINRVKSKSIKKELFSGSGVRSRSSGASESDISDLSRMAEASRQDDEADDAGSYYDEVLLSRMADDPELALNRMRLEEAAAARLPSVGVSRIVLEGLAAIIIVTSLMAFIWGFIRLKAGRNNIPSMSTCYAVDARRATLHDVESRSRYFKLQATTSL